MTRLEMFLAVIIGSCAFLLVGRHHYLACCPGSGSDGAENSSPSLIPGLPAGRKQYFQMSGNTEPAEAGHGWEI
jgi:hypothetical protein